jgi:hypothetical protein
MSYHKLVYHAHVKYVKLKQWQVEDTEKRKEKDLDEASVYASV